MKAHLLILFKKPIKKGIDVGDVGPKYGYNSKDNGFLILNQVRINENDLVW